MRTQNTSFSNQRFTCGLENLELVLHLVVDAVPELGLVLHLNERLPVHVRKLVVGRLHLARRALLQL